MAIDKIMAEDDGKRPTIRRVNAFRGEVGKFLEVGVPAISRVRGESGRNTMISIPLAFGNPL